jgi:hypothetical protein
MTDNTTPDFDAAILHVVNQQRLEAGQKPISELGHIGETRKFVGGIIAKLLEGMEIAELSHWHAGYAEISHWRTGYNAALTKIRRRAGLEVES